MDMNLISQASFVMKEDFSFTEVKQDPPPIISVQEVYNELWEIAGPTIEELETNQKKER